KQVGSAGFYIELAVVDPSKPGKYILGIECDGASYHSARSARDRDRLRQEVLEGLGWKIHRIWSTDWFRHPERELARIIEGIEQARSGARAEGSTEQAVHSRPAAVNHVEIQREENENHWREQSKQPSPLYELANFKIDLEGLELQSI